MSDAFTKKNSLSSKKLDRTTAELKRTSVALEKEKEKTDMLLYQMLPKKVANQLRDGISVDAGKFLNYYNNKIWLHQCLN